jgi:hypothetical protein
MVPQRMKARGQRRSQRSNGKQDELVTQQRFIGYEMPTC